MRPETKLQVELCEGYLDEYYPSLVYHSDLSAGAALSVGQAVLNKRMQYDNGLPDLYILEPFRTYSGMCMELKAKGRKIVRTKDAKKVLKGETKLRHKYDWWDNKIEQQAKMLAILREKGYWADFVIGLDAAKKLIDEHYGHLQIKPKG